MAKKLPTGLIGQTVKLLPSLCDIQGEPHPYAGQEVTILDRSGRTSYSASTADDSIIVVKPEDWGPSNAVTQAMLATPTSAVSTEVAQQLQTINLYTDPALNVVQQLLLGTVKESPFNPRTNYPEDAMAEMAESAKAVGITQPVLVRPLGDGSYELVFGHRRYRAAKMAALSFLPAIVRELTDAQSAQLQAVENSQRKDLDPIDEGLGYSAYIAAHNISKDELCLQIGKSRTHVYNRLKLATLRPDGQKALRAGRIRAEVATLIARVPGEKHQAHALKLVLDNTTQDEDAPEEALMTVRKARDMLREKFTLGLKDAIWAHDDAGLVASAGACTVCPKRSGVDPVLYTDLFGKPHTWSSTPSGENVCTDPACFDTKKTAQLKRDQAALEAKGEVVIAGNKARQTIGADGTVKNGYVALKDVKAEITRINKQAKTSGGEAQPVEIITVQNPRDGKTIKVVKVAAIQEAGGKIEEPKPGRHDSRAAEAEREAKKAKAEADTAFYMALFTQVRAAAAKASRTTLDLQLIASRLFECLDWDEKEIIANAQGFGTDHGAIQKLEKSIGSMSAEQLAILLLDCVLTEDLEQTGYWNDNKPEALLAAAKQYGVDVKASRKAHDNAIKKQAKAPAALEADEQVEEDEVDA